MASHVSTAERFRRHVFDSIPAARNLLNHVRKQGAQTHSVSSRRSLGVQLPSPHAGRAGMLLLYCPPATPQGTSPAVTLGNYSLLITHSDMPVMDIMENLTAY